MQREQIKELIELGKAMDLKVTPTEIKGDLGVCYGDFEQFDYVVAVRELLALRKALTGKL